MNNVTWVVQANLLNRTRQDDVAEILKELDIPFVGVNVIPFSDELTFLFDEPQHTAVIPYGSTSLIRRATLRNWQGLFFDQKTFDVDVWIKNRTDMLNQSAFVLSVKDALDLKLEPDTYWHIRPTEDLKLFAGMVMDSGELQSWLRKTDSVQLDSGLLSMDTTIAIAPAQALMAEWRWFIVNGKVCDGSMYRMNTEPNRKHETDQAVIDEAQILADKWLPYHTCVMDLALTEAGVKVIEFNCFNGSGFYDHDVKKILRNTTDYLLKI